MCKRFALCLFVLAFMLASCALSEEPAPIANVSEQPSIITAAESVIVDEADSMSKTPDDFAPAEIMKETVFEERFYDGLGALQPRGNAMLDIVKNNDDVPDSAYCLKVTGRTATWNGAMVDMTEVMEIGRHYNVSAWVKYDEGFGSIPISIMLERNGGEYLGIGTVKAEKGQWTYLTGDIVIPSNTETAVVYFETQWKQAFTKEDLCDLYIAGIVITEETVVLEDEVIPALKTSFEDYFLIGTGIEPDDLDIPEIRDIVLKHFDTVTCGNEMKPDFLLDRNRSISDPSYDTCPAINPARADIIMEFAAEHGLKVRGHTLVWHSQTPRWLFTVGYSTDANAEFVDRGTMLLRMENYIRQVLEYFQTKYPGVIIAWDVVNEAIETGDRHMKGYRVKESLWYQVIGQDYIEQAFTFARKYADPGVKLFYNDYNTFISDRMYRMIELVKDLKEKGLIDGMGMQSHIEMDFPSLFTYEDAIRKYCELGVEVHITELDMGLRVNDDESLMKQGLRYARLSEIYRRLRDDGLPITSVTVWGVADHRSWLNADGPSYPLLFDKYFNPKPAFWGLYDPRIFFPTP